MATTVYFATNRARRGDGSLPIHYAGEDGPAGEPDQLSFGTAIVSPPNIDELKTGELMSLSSIAAEAFDQGVEAEIAQPGRNLIVFMHGFANSFTDSITRAAFNREWFAASGFAGSDCAIVGFSWPSQGKTVASGDIAGGVATLFLSLAILATTGHTESPLANAYRADQAAAKASAPAIISFLDRLRPLFGRVRSGGGRVILLAHSMGNRAMQYAIQRWATMGSLPDLLFDEAISAAADTDWAEASLSPAWFDALRRTSGRVSLYHSEADKILRLSQVVNEMRRLGRSGPPEAGNEAVFPPNGFRFIDCSRVIDQKPGGGVDHSHQYYRRVTAVRDDIALAFRGQGAPGSIVLA
ncbi:alpha/beta hydrolase [Roseococcus sp. YIM B11640]|uniref:alpha/beta hydrolase n=1 Tax=Roseococcus sp. YIM B11640 TaxID=3133973 RepID=UPI003C7B18EC